MNRDLTEILRARDYTDGKAVVIFGVRGVGKTKLVRDVIGAADSISFDGADPAFARGFHFSTTADARTFLFAAPNIVIENAQDIPDCLRSLKILADVNETLRRPARLFVTAAADFVNGAGSGESAVGRFELFCLWPAALTELAKDRGDAGAAKDIAERLVFGMLPDVITSPETAGQPLARITDSVLYADILGTAAIRKPKAFLLLVRRLADLIGSEVSYDALARETGLSKHTVSDYIALLEAHFVVRQCASLSVGHPAEIRKGKKIYFCDLGIRNALLRRFEPLEERTDAAALWENFVFMERVKHLEERCPGAQIRFWRLKAPQTQKIDFVEEWCGTRRAFDCRLSNSGLVRLPAAFAKACGTCDFRVVTPQNILKLEDRES